ncbi:MAG TPA: sigma-70 family RNA polymerase sigma factor [Candidatus Sulfotelmatobacter sp.]|nr:sigma-70 family RNA polymerase sigma factor [Candidatus Sulfotelmatobacter sp.]
MMQRDVVLARYCTERTVERRNAVVDAYRHLCRRGARKFKRAVNDWADLEQVAAIGLIKAVDYYRAELRTPFEAYAWLLIVGELMHYVRDHERLVRVPRALRSLERRSVAVWEAFVVDHQREPTRPELAAALGVPLALLGDVQAVRGIDHVALPDPGLAEDAVRVDLLADRTDPLGFEERVALALALDELGERERAVVLGTFGAGLTQSEIGSRLGLSQSHVSKLLARALGQLGPLVA